MNKKDFINYVSQLIAKKKLQFNPNEAEKLVNVVFESVVSLLARGDEVRFPKFGVFYPKVSQRQGVCVASKIGFDSFSTANSFLFNNFTKMKLFNGDPDLGSVRVFSSEGTVKYVDASGQEYLNLSSIARQSGVSIPTAYKYADKYKDKIDSKQTASGRKFHPDTVELFKKIKSENTRGNEPKPKPEKKKMELKESTTGLSLSEVSITSGVSLVTLYKYLKKYQKELQLDKYPDGKYDTEFVNRCAQIKSRNMTWIGK